MGHKLQGHYVNLPAEKVASQSDSASVLIELNFLFAHIVKGYCARA